MPGGMVQNRRWSASPRSNDPGIRYSLFEICLTHYPYRVTRLAHFFCLAMLTAFSVASQNAEVMVADNEMGGLVGDTRLHVHASAGGEIRGGFA